MACSVSRDGLVLLWDLLDGTRRLSTSMDVEPVHAAFTWEGKQLSTVDRSGQLHTWKLENRSGLGSANAPEQDTGSTTAAEETAVVEACLRAAEQVGRSIEAIAHGNPATAPALLSDLGLLRHGAMDVLFAGVRAPSTLGSHLRSYTWGNALQLEKAGRELLARLSGWRRCCPGPASWPSPTSTRRRNGSTAIRRKAPASATRRSRASQCWSAG